jgi:U3 small nucleolar RNA-associated protein 14
VYEEEPAIPKITESMREVPRAAEPVREVVTSPDEKTLEDHDVTEVQEPPQMTFSHKRKSAWAREFIKDGEKYGVPEGTSRQVKRPKPFSNYTALMCDLLDEEPTYFEEAIQKKEWADAMTEEYQSIIKNNVWKIVLRPKSKDVVSSKWLFKIKHVANGSIEKYKEIFVARGFFHKEGIDYEKTSAPVVRYT